MRNHIQGSKSLNHEESAKSIVCIIIAMLLEVQYLDKYLIGGGRKLCGEAYVQGSKNAILPIMAAAILSGDVCEIYDCPEISDVDHTINILNMLGCSAILKGETLTIDSGKMDKWQISESLMREMRSSIIFLGALASKMGRASLCAPGGCELGNRPIDLHIKALKELGMKIQEENGYLEADARYMHPGDIHLSFPSVGATENIILSSVKLKGETTISNAAKEPEIVDMCDFLNKMGADIEGAGTEFITIKGVPHLKGAKHRVIPDRIVAATLMCAVMSAGGEIELLNIRSEHIGAIIALMRECGAKIEIFKNKMYIKAPEKILPINIIKTQVFPGFPTDAQSVMLAMLAKAEGTSVIVENVFDSRFKIIPELALMGADILQDGRVAIIKGTHLKGANVRAMDLRGGAALTLAAIGAEGESTVSGVHFIERGYMNFDKTLASLGAKIEKV